MDREQIVLKIKNSIFPSKEEENSIEHIGMGLKEFEDLIQELSDTAFNDGYNCARGND